MDVDIPIQSSLQIPIPVSLWCFLGKEGVKKMKTDLPLGHQLDLSTLKEFVCRVVGSISPEEIDILYNGGVLRDETVKTAVFRPQNVITVIKKAKPVKGMDGNMEAAGNTGSKITQVAIALKTAFMNPDFVPMIMKLGQTDLLVNVLAIAPGLQSDPVGIAMIQDPVVMHHLSDYEPLKKLASKKPWMVEAFKFLAGSVNQDKGVQGSRRFSNIPSAMLNSALLGDDDDDDMEEDEESGGAPSSRITREQLSAALGSLNALAGRGPLQTPSSSNTPTASAASSLFNMMGQNQNAPATSPQASAQGTNIAPSIAEFGRMLSAVMPGATSTGLATTPVLTPEMVARAMRTALSSLPSNARDGQVLREQIPQTQSNTNTSLNNSAAGATIPTTQAPHQPSGNSQFAQQLIQMRAMGVQDERLSLLALRVSDGDLQTAVELIFSGWSGEGADVEMPDEE